MEGWVDLGDCLHSEMVYPPTDNTHLSTNDRESNSQPVDHESDVLTTTSPSHPSWFRTVYSHVKSSWTFLPAERTLQWAVRSSAGEGSRLLKDDWCRRSGQPRITPSSCQYWTHDGRYQSHVNTCVHICLSGCLSQRQENAPNSSNPFFLFLPFIHCNGKLSCLK